MNFLKRFTTWLLLLTVLTASGVVSAKVASGVQNFTGEVYQENLVDNALIHLAKIDFSYDATSGFPLAPKNTKLFRAVSEAEFKQIQKTGRFEAGPNSLGGKFFAESVDDAKRWGDVLNGPGKSRIIETQLPKNVADGLQRWERLDGIGPARYGELNQLRDAIIREVK